VNSIVDALCNFKEVAAAEEALITNNAYFDGPEDEDGQNILKIPESRFFTFNDLP
jgi:hypothetical protein